MLSLAMSVLLMLGATTLYAISNARRVSFGQIRAQQLASQRAQMAAESVIARLRGGQLVLAAPQLPCTADLLNCDAMFQVIEINGRDPDTSPDADMVLARVVLYRRFVAGFTRASTMLLATGFSHREFVGSPASPNPNVVTGLVEVEVQTAVISTMGNNVAGGS